MEQVASIKRAALAVIAALIVMASFQAISVGQHVSASSLPESSEGAAIPSVTQQGGHARHGVIPAPPDRVLRCGNVLGPEHFLDEGGVAGGSFADCNGTFTNPLPSYAPTSIRYRIPVVVHVMRNTAGTLGHLSVAQIQAQINVLNEDYRALTGTPGAPGFNCEIEFYLTPNYGTTPGTGVLYYNNDNWYNEDQSDTYFNTIAVDTLNYLNIYTCVPHISGQEVLGYAFYPFQPTFGTNGDRVVINWNVVGDPCPGGFGGAYGYACMGRIATHEVGHYLGLYHTFQGGCGTTSPPGCYSTGDLVCDTNATANPNFFCQTTLNTCGDGLDNVRNYMDYSDDVCLTNFTSEQARRMRCVLEHRRTQLPEIVSIACPADVDGSESVDVNDLISVILLWGSCDLPCPPHCSADVVENCAVDVDDLIAVILGWGACP